MGFRGYEYEPKPRWFVGAYRWVVDMVGVVVAAILVGFLALGAVGVNAWLIWLWVMNA